MRGLLQVGALAACCAAVPATRAEAQVTFGVGGGLSLPLSDLKTAATTGYNVLGQLGIAVPFLPIGLRIDGMFNSFKHQPNIPFNNVQLWTVNANAVWNISPISSAGAGVTPYLIGGAGYYNDQGGCDVRYLSVPGITACPGGNTHSNYVGLNGGGGVRAGIASLSVFVEARFHYVFTSGGHLEFVPITAGIIF
jgi:hypothetical protein